MSPHDQAEAMSMADQVVLLNHGRVEQAAAPRALYNRPSTAFAAGFIGTPAMNLLRLEAGRIAGSDIEIDARAGCLGLRPESVGIGNRIPAVVRGIEYLGADLIVRCAIGSQTLSIANRRAGESCRRGAGAARLARVGSAPLRFKGPTHRLMPGETG
jgi:sn-glycerol 3-phosphate transport system ATP-binding protein